MPDTTRPWSWRGWREADDSQGGCSTEDGIVKYLNRSDFSQRKFPVFCVVTAASERIQALESSIREVELKVQQLNRMLAALNQKYKPQVRLLVLVLSLIFLYQMSEVEQELRKYKDSLRKVLEEMCNSAMTRYDLTSELGIYGQLLTYEETRMTTHSSEVLGIPLDIRLLI